MKFKPMMFATVAAVVASPVLAQTTGTGPDIQTLVDSVNVDDIVQAVLTVGGLGVAIRLAWVAVKYVRGLTKSS